MPKFIIYVLLLNFVHEIENELFSALLYQSRKTFTQRQGKNQKTKTKKKNVKHQVKVS